MKDKPKVVKQKGWIQHHSEIKIFNVQRPKLKIGSWVNEISEGLTVKSVKTTYIEILSVNNSIVVLYFNYLFLF